MLPDPLIEGASCYNHGKFSSPSPREERAGRGMGRGASSRMGLLSPTLSSCWGGEGANLLRLLGGCNKMRPRTGTMETSARSPAGASWNHHQKRAETERGCVRSTIRALRLPRLHVHQDENDPSSCELLVGKNRSGRRNFVPLPRLVHPI